MDASLISITRTKEGAIVEYSGANNPLWIARNSKDGLVVDSIAPDKQPVGYYDHIRAFSHTR